MPIPRVMTLATLKGGGGKSTLAAGLAAYWHHHRETPALLDADLLGGSTRFHDASGLLGNLVVKPAPSDSVSDLVRRLAKHHRPVIIDTPDFRNSATTDAIAASDLVLVPIKPAALDVKAALETRHLVDEINATKERAGHPVAIRFILTMTVPGSDLARHVRAEIDRAGLTLLKAEFALRAGHGDLPLSELARADQSGFAMGDVARIARELENLKI